MHHCTSLILALLFVCLGMATAPKGDYSTRFHFITLPSSNGAGPCDIDTGPDGESIWFRDIKANTIGVYFVKSKKVQEFVLPNPEPPVTPSPGGPTPPFLQCFVRTGKDGYIYSGDPQYPDLIRVNPKTYEITTFENSRVDGLVIGVEDGYAATSGLVQTFRNQNAVEFFDYKTNKFTLFELPTPNSGPVGVRGDDRGFVWITEFDGERFGRFNFTSGELKEFPIPQPAGSFPGLMRAYTEKRYLWANGQSGLIRLDTLGESQEVYLYPNQDTSPTENDNDPSGNIWLSSAALNSLVYFMPSTAEWTYVTIPGGTPAPSANRSIPVHYGPLNSIWFTRLDTGQLGYYELD